MALFTKKKRTLEEILEDVSALSPEELNSLRERLGEAEKESDDEPAPDNDNKDEVCEENPEACETAEEAEEEAEEHGEEPDAIQEQTPEPLQDDPVSEENASELIKALTERVSTLETALGELTELKSKMDEYVAKQKDAFGYRSEGAEVRKDYEDMTADELKNHILHK